MKSGVRDARKSERCEEVRKVGGEGCEGGRGETRLGEDEVE